MSLLNIFYSFYFDYLENINSYLIVLVLSTSTSFALTKIGRSDKDNINIYE